MKNIVKIFILLFVLLISLACSLPFLTGGSPGASSTPESSTPERATPTEEEISDGVDPCLIGTWTMDTYALNNKFMDLTHSPIMFIAAPSSMSLVLGSDGAYTINGVTIVQTDIPDTSDFMQITGTQAGQGSYSADGTSLFITNSTFTVEYGPMTSSIDGEITEAPASAIPLPDDLMSPPATAEYQCSDHSLEITYESPTSTITEEWIR